MGGEDELKVADEAFLVGVVMVELQVSRAPSLPSFYKGVSVRVYTRKKSTKNVNELLLEPCGMLSIRTNTAAVL